MYNPSVEVKSRIIRPLYARTCMKQKQVESNLKIIKNFSPVSYLWFENKKKSSKTRETQRFCVVNDKALSSGSAERLDES